MWVGLGVLNPIARILNTIKADGKRRDLDENGSARHCRSPFVRTDDEEARLQAIIIVGSLANGWSFSFISSWDEKGHD